MTAADPSDDALRALAVALAASIACHALLLAEWHWSVPVPTPALQALLTGVGATTSRQDDSLRVELVSAHSGDAPAEARPLAAAPGTANDVTVAPALAAPVQKRPRVPRPPPLPPEQQGRVSVGAFEDIGAVDSALGPAVAAEFPDAVTARPQLQQELVIAYPEDALRERRRMTVGVLVIVDEQGKVERTAKSFDDLVFAAAIDAALKDAQFNPALRDGHPVRFWTVLVVDFSILGPPIFP